MNAKSVNRREFIAAFIKAGLKYRQACDAYNAMTDVFRDAIVAGNRVNVGRVGALVPTVRPPRVVNMGLKSDASGGYRKYLLGRRVRYKFTMFKRFIDNHQLRWF